LWISQIPCKRLHQLLRSRSAEHVAIFLGHKLSAHYQGELGNDFSTGIRHHMGPASLKLYDKAGLIARVECTANDVTFLKHHRHMEQRNGEWVFKLAPLGKSIYSLGDLRRVMHAANSRYLAFMACLDNPMPLGRRWPKWPHRPRSRGVPSAASTCETP
jgi:hypothetical protein